MTLVCHARLAITESGGIQEETTYRNIPCLTLRPNPERPITVTQGTNRLVRPETLGEMVDRALNGELKPVHRPALWDGRTAERVVQSLYRHSVRELAERSEEHTSELQSLMRISYAVFCLKKKTQEQTHTHNNRQE